MDNQKVSIIVPVYNVAQYLDECVQSLIEQSYGNLEIILIDDGAKDASPAICDAWAAKDSRIRVIHKANGGAASARNAGMDAATGDLICFVDSDDVLHPEYVEILLDQLLITDADIAVCGFSQFSKCGEAVYSEREPAGYYDREAYLSQLLKSWTCSLLWNKIYRRNVIGALRMVEGHQIDDEFFTYQVVLRAKKITVFDRPLYRYRLRASSVMGNSHSRKEKILLDRIGYNTMRYQHIAMMMPRLEEPFFVNTLDTIARYWHYSKGMPVAQKAIRNWVNAHAGRILKLPVPLRQRLGYLNRLYLRKPAVTAEPNPIQMEQQEYFE